MSQVFYADSSVLVKLHVREIGSEWLKSLLVTPTTNRIITATLSIVEVLSSLNRRQRENSITRTEYSQIAEDFLIISNNEYRLIQLTPQVIIEAQRILENYPLRAGDSLQLASAALARTTTAKTNLGAPVFLSSDNKLLNAAIAEGFTTDDPLLHP